MLKRYGRTLIFDYYTTCTIYANVRKVNTEKYLARFRKDHKEKKVYVIDEDSWSECFLGNWFVDNFHMLDFQEIFEQRSKPYMDLKAKLNFHGFPDFLATRKGKLLRVELECFSSLFWYMHQADYCEVVLCYDHDGTIEDMEVHDLKGILGYENIINKSEIFEYMYLQYGDFRQEIIEKNQELMKKRQDEAMRASE
jgi:hypothetical protein